MWMHLKSQRVHAPSSLPEMTLCGLDTWKAKRTNTDWKKVNCGNCRAVAATSPDNSPIQRTVDSEFFYDSGNVYRVCVWEKVRGIAYVCSTTGQRLPHKAVSWDVVEELYGPMRRTTLAEVVSSKVAELEARLGYVE